MSLLSPIRRFLAALGCIAALASCSNDPNPDPLHTTRPDGAPWVASYLRIGEDPRSLDPQFSYDVLGNVLISQIYEPLLQYNLFKTDPYELEPCLAEGMPRHIVNADGTEAYEVRIKKGVRFQDDPAFPGGKGREVTAHDFVYTFQRIADPKVECPVVSTLQEFIAGLKPAYDEAVKTGRFDYARPTGAITVIDDHTFRLNLLKPYPQALYWLAMPFTAPVAREVVAYYNGKEGREPFKFKPVGTGPFKLVEWSRGRLMRLERNPHYTTTRFPEGGWPSEDEARFRPMAGAALPFLDEIQFAIIREQIPAWLLFRQGYLDRTGVNKDVFSTVVTNSMDLSLKYEGRGVHLFKDVEPTTYYIQFNMEDPVVGKNTKLRQALSLVYDDQRANDLFSNGVDLKATQLLPPGVVGHEKELPNPWREANLEKARALLAEAGYPNGIGPDGKRLQLRLEVMANSSGQRQRAEFDKAQFEKLGINLEVVDNNWATFQDKLTNGNFQMNTGSGWHADYPDAENFFFLFYGKNIPPRGHNTVRFTNPEFDRLFEQMATMENSPERLALIHRMNELLNEECPIILLGHPVLFSLNQPWLPRVTSNSMASNGFKYLQIDSALRARLRAEWNRKPLWPIWVVLGLAVLAGGYTFRRIRNRNV